MRNYTGEKLQNIADVLFVCLIVLISIAGVAYWAILRGVIGFIVCLIIVGAGILSAFIYKYVLKGFGEVVEHQAEQTQLLIRMTEYLKASTINPGGPSDRWTPGPVAPAQTPVMAQSHAGVDQTPTARFATRSTIDIACPVCGKQQMSNRNLCYACGCKFIYDDEQQPPS